MAADNNLKSAFDIIGNTKKDIFAEKKVNKDILNFQELSQANTLNLILLKYNIGKINHVSVKLNEEAIFENLKIEVEHCLRESDKVLNPVNMAYIKIKNDNDTLVFNGWIFSKSSAISLPNSDGYFFFLENCS